MNKGLTLKKKKIKIKKINTRKYRFNFKILLAILITIIGVLIIKSQEGFIKDFCICLKDRLSSFGAGYSLPIEIEGHRVFANNVCIINGNIAVLSDMSFAAYAFSGKKIASRVHNFSNPSMKSCGEKAIIYNMGGHDYRIESCSETVLQGNAEEKIICSDVSQNGTHVLVTESNEYLSQMTVFSRDKKEQYKYSFADFYICDVAIQPNGKGAAVCGISSCDGDICSAVYIFDFSSVQPVYTYEFKENMFISVKYLSNNNLITVGDKFTAFIDASKNVKKEIDYESKVIKCMDVNKKSGIAYCLSLSDTDKTSELEIVDISGDIKLKKEICHAFSDIKYEENRLFGIENNTIFVYNVSGELEKEINIGFKPDKIIRASVNKICVLEGNAIKEITV